MAFRRALLLRAMAIGLVIIPTAGAVEPIRDYDIVIRGNIVDHLRCGDIHPSTIQRCVINPGESDFQRNVIILPVRKTQFDSYRAIDEFDKIIPIEMERRKSQIMNNYYQLTPTLGVWFISIDSARFGPPAQRMLEYCVEVERGAAARGRLSLRNLQVEAAEAINQLYPAESVNKNWHYEYYPMERRLHISHALRSFQIDDGCSLREELNVKRYRLR